jgi:hypothetical protein
MGSSAALESERYAVHAIPTVDTKGYIMSVGCGRIYRGNLTSWNWIGMIRKLII